MSQHGIYKVNLPLYDGSQTTMLGVCLDNITSKFPLYPVLGKVLNGITKAYDILAKERNNMNKLLELVIRWYIHKVAFDTDIQKMYNSIKLHEQNWCLQRYIWQQGLDPTKIPEEKVIKTLIYGVQSG